MDDWKLKVRTVVKLEREPNMSVSLYFVSRFISLVIDCVVMSRFCFTSWISWMQQGRSPFYAVSVNCL